MNRYQLLVRRGSVASTLTSPPHKPMPIRRRQKELPDVDNALRSPVKRAYTQADEQQQQTNLATHQTRAIIIHLNRFDSFTLSNIMHYLSTTDILLLNRVGDSQLTTKLHAKITSLHFTRATMPFAHPITPQGKLHEWCWPTILTQPLPLLTAVSVSQTKWYTLEGIRLDVLPPSLTTLLLSNITGRTRSIEHAIFRLPNLVKLNISLVRMTAGKYGSSGPSLKDVKWLIPSLQYSPLLADVNYTYMEGHSDASCLAMSSLPLLEELAVMDFSVPKQSWPRRLHTLCIAGNGTANGWDIPDTVTSLTLTRLLTNKMVVDVLEHCPSTLRHLHFNAEAVTFDRRLLVTLSRFTQLQTLIAHQGWEYAKVIMTPNMSLLPRSITKLSNSFAFKPSEWKHLPPNATLVARPGFTFSAFSDTSDFENGFLPHYCAARDVAYVDDFPKGMMHVMLEDSALPVGAAPQLEHVHFNITTPRFSRPQCAPTLANLPTVLKSMTITLQQSKSMFWLGVNVAERFPKLESLVLYIKDAVISNETILKWLAHLPITLRRLKLKIAQRVQPIAATYKSPLRIGNISLPPKLQDLSITCRDRLMDLPAILPASLQTIELAFFDVKPETSVANISKWPSSLHEVVLATINNPEKSAVRYAALAELRARNERRSTYG